MTTNNESQQSPELEKIQSGLRSLQVRPVILHRLWPGGSHGEYTPTAEAWADGTPATVATDIRNFIGSKESRLRLRANRFFAEPLRREAIGRFSDLAYLKPGPSLMGCVEVVGVDEFSIGNRGRSLPILRLVDPVGPLPEEELAITLPDLARYVQRDSIVLQQLSLLTPISTHSVASPSFDSI